MPQTLTTPQARVLSKISRTPGVRLGGHETRAAWALRADGYVERDGLSWAATDKGRAFIEGRG
jgi:hypothetical protein